MIMKYDKPQDKFLKITLASVDLGLVTPYGTLAYSHCVSFEV